MTKLPELPLTPKVTQLLDKAFLDFLTTLYIASKKTQIKDVDANIWFLQEIAHYLIVVYPEKTMDELEDTLLHIAEMAKGEKE